MFYKLLILSLFLVSGYCQDSRPTITLYNNYDIINATYINIFHADFPKIDYVPFQNSHRLCFDGVWLGYIALNYSWTPSLHSNMGYCFTPGAFHFRSLRVIGHPTNYSTPALSLFTKIDWNNENNSVDPPNLRLEDDPDLGGKYASLILNGDQPITLYTGANFGGFKLCIEPKQVNEIVTYVRNVEDLGITPDMIKSFRFGCHSKNIARIKNNLISPE